MDIIKLKSFLIIANLLSFSEASEELYVSQSSLSKQIISLEKEFGYQLFDRSKKRISLTTAGNLTLNHVQTIVMEYETLIQELKNLNHDSLNMVKISSIPVMAHYGFTSLIGNFAKINPTIIINVQELEGNQIIPSLVSMEYDFAFMRSDSIDPLKYESIPLYEDCLVAVLPLNHPLAKKSLISISQLAQDFFLFFDPVTLMYDISYNACIRCGFKPKVIHTGTRVENIAELISSGMGVSLIMEKVVTYLNNSFLSIVPLKEVIISQLSLVRIRDRKMNETSMLFWNQIKKRDFGGIVTQL